MMEQTGGGTGLPADRSYLECGLPDFLRESIAQMQAAWDRLDRGEKDLRWDCDYCNCRRTSTMRRSTRSSVRSRRGISGRSICGWRGGKNIVMLAGGVDCQEGGSILTFIYASDTIQIQK